MGVGLGGGPAPAAPAADMGGGALGGLPVVLLVPGALGGVGVGDWVVSLVGWEVVVTAAEMGLANGRGVLVGVLDGGDEELVANGDAVGDGVMVLVALGAPVGRGVGVAVEV